MKPTDKTGPADTSSESAWFDRRSISRVRDRTSGTMPSARRPDCTRMRGALYCASGTKPPTDGAYDQSGGMAARSLSENECRVAGKPASRRVVTLSQCSREVKLSVRRTRRLPMVRSSDNVFPSAVSATIDSPLLNASSTQADPSLARKRSRSLPAAATASTRMRAPVSTARVCACPCASEASTSGSNAILFGMFRNLYNLSARSIRDDTFAPPVPLFACACRGPDLWGPRHEDRLCRRPSGRSRIGLWGHFGSLCRFGGQRYDRLPYARRGWHSAQ